MRVLIVKLSSLGDVVHTMPVVHDIHAAHPGALIDWVVEPAFAPLLRRVDGVDEVIECALRRWRSAWWSPAVWREIWNFKWRLQREHYDAVLELQGLTKSALVAWLARGRSHGLANRTDGASFERPARWLVHNPIEVPVRIHAMDRARHLAAAALHYTAAGPPVYGLRAAAHKQRAPTEPTVVFVHGTSRDDKLWPVSSWIQLGKRFLAAGWRIALPQGSEVEQTRAEMIAAGWEFEPSLRVEVWPTLGLSAVEDRIAAAQGVIGVDSGLSHVAVALRLPHVQIYNFPTAWRTGPLAEHGHRHQTAVEGPPMPTVDAVWAAWSRVTERPR